MTETREKYIDSLVKKHGEVFKEYLAKNPLVSIAKIAVLSSIYRMMT